MCFCHVSAALALFVSTLSWLTLFFAVASLHRTSGDALLLLGQRRAHSATRISLTRNMLASWSKLKAIRQEQVGLQQRGMGWTESLASATYIFFHLHVLPFINFFLLFIPRASPQLTSASK
jgi:hypothetical protein